jgi:hypothetical protein
MPILLFIFSKSKFHIFLFKIGISHLSGQPILPHQLRCSPIAVFKYSFMSHCLAALAISTG